MPSSALVDRVLVQYFIHLRCLNKVSAPTASYGHVMEWNATTQVQNPIKII
jgi:hypothetical protein